MLICKTLNYTSLTTPQACSGQIVKLKGEGMLNEVQLSYVNSTGKCGHLILGLCTLLGNIEFSFAVVSVQLDMVIPLSASFPRFRTDIKRPFLLKRIGSTTQGLWDIFTHHKRCRRHRWFINGLYLGPTNVMGAPVDVMWWEFFKCIYSLGIIGSASVCCPSLVPHGASYFEIWLKITS